MNRTPYPQANSRTRKFTSFHVLYCRQGMQKRALITGASAGIGRELATVFAEYGFSLVLVARNEARLNQLADQLRSAHKIEVVVLAQDLAQPGAASEVFRRLTDTPVSVLVNNAGFGAYGPFAET